MAKRTKGVGPYAGVGDLKITRDKRIDDSGNYKPGPGDRRQQGGAFGRQIDVDAGGAKSGKPAPVTDATFSGGAMSRGVSSPKAKRYIGG
jgi:hypothetical protein